MVPETEPFIPSEREAAPAPEGREVQTSIEAFIANSGDGDAAPPAKVEEPPKGKEKAPDADEIPEDEEGEFEEEERPRLSATDRLDRIERGLSELLESAPRGEPAKEKGTPEADEELLEQPPVVQRIYRELAEMKAEFRVEAEQRKEERITAAEREYVRERRDAAKTFAMTKGEVRTVEQYLVSNPDAAAVLSFEEGARRVLGPSFEARRGSRQPDARHKPPAGGKPPAKIVDAGGGSTSPPKELEVPPGARMSDISTLVLEKHFGIRR